MYMSYVNIFYQAIKVFYLSRVNIKSLKSTLELINDTVTIPDYYLKP